MNHTAFPMEIIETEEGLLDDALDDMHRECAVRLR